MALFPIRMGWPQAAASVIPYSCKVRHADMFLAAINAPNARERMQHYDVCHPLWQA